MSRRRRLPGAPLEGEGASRLIRLAVALAIVGTALVTLFLILGFRSWTVGLGIFIGLLVLVLATVLYVVAVLRDLRRRDVL